MDYQTGFFYLFSCILLFAAFRVVTAQNPVHAVLYLMLSFSQAAAIWLILKAEFLGLTLVLVYLGAVMVLFLFVVMMLDIRLDDIRSSFWQHIPLALFLGGIVALELIAVLSKGFAGLQMPTASSKTNTYDLGILLYTEYLYPVQAAAVILLVAMIAAIALTLRERKDTKKTDPSIQVRVRPSDRLSLVSISPTSALDTKGSVGSISPEEHNK
jgi:NADH-quinone oxidoreductase subunit J